VWDCVPFGGWFTIKIKNHDAMRMIRLGEGVYSFMRLKNPHWSCPYWYGRPLPASLCQNEVVC
jgi:hypothetical protein